MSDPIDKSGENSAAEEEGAERNVEELAKELADKLRGLKNRDELTDYAVSLLRESNEEADQKEYQKRTSRGPGRAIHSIRSHLGSRCWSSAWCSARPAS